MIVRGVQIQCRRLSNGTQDNSRYGWAESGRLVPEREISVGTGCRPKGPVDRCRRGGYHSFMSSYRKPSGRPAKPASPVDQEDAFVATTLHATQWAQRNRPILTLGIVLAAVIVAGIVYYVRYQNTLNSGAALQLEEIQQRLDTGDQAGSQADLELFLERFDGTPSADEARIALAQISAEAGEREAAAEILEPLARDMGSPLGPQAAGLLAAISEDAGNLETAEALYLRLADQSRLGFQVRDALAAAARIRWESGDAAGAMELYDRLLARMDETDPDRGLVEMRRAEAEVVALRTASGAP